MQSNGRTHHQQRLCICPLKIHRVEAYRGALDSAMIMSRSRSEAETISTVGGHQALLSPRCLAFRSRGSRSHQPLLYSASYIASTLFLFSMSSSIKSTSTISKIVTMTSSTAYNCKWGILATGGIAETFFQGPSYRSFLSFRFRC